MQKLAIKNDQKCANTAAKCYNKKLSIELESRINGIAFNYQERSIPFENSTLFKANYNIMFISCTRNETINQIYYENIIFCSESEPCSLCPRKEHISIFCFDFKEPAMHFLTPPFSAKK